MHKCLCLIGIFNTPNFVWRRWMKQENVVWKFILNFACWLMICQLVYVQGTILLIIYATNSIFIKFLANILPYIYIFNRYRLHWSTWVHSYISTAICCGGQCGRWDESSRSSSCWLQSIWGKRRSWSHCIAEVERGRWVQTRFKYAGELQRIHH